MHILARCSRTVRAVSTCIFCSWDNINHTCSPIVSNWSVFSAAQRKVNLLLLTKRLCDKTNRPIKAEENCFLYSSTVPVMLCTRVNKHTCFRLLHKETVLRVNTHGVYARFYLWGKRWPVQVWKKDPHYFWLLQPAECWDHYLEPAAESAEEMWVRGAGGRPSLHESLLPWNRGGAAQAL